MLEHSVQDNTGLATFRRHARAGLVDRAGEKRRADDVTSQLNVRMAGLGQPIRNLSGGNQQKVVFGRWVLADTRILLLDEPTRGVDVGAKVEIYELINAITDNGGAVLMVSSELPEALGMSDRLLVMSAGRATGVLESNTASEDDVMALAVSNIEPAQTISSEGEAA